MSEVDEKKIRITTFLYLILARMLNDCFFSFIKVLHIHNTLFLIQNYVVNFRCHEKELFPTLHKYRAAKIKPENLIVCLLCYIIVTAFPRLSQQDSYTYYFEPHFAPLTYTEF
jgi:hypothetical protein